MEAQCVSLSLFSNKIKKTHLSLWVDYIIQLMLHFLMQDQDLSDLFHFQ